MNLTSTKAYGRVVLAVVVSVALWSAWDAQASIEQPGWFAGWRSSVWCKTVLYGPEFGTGTFFHYPGKRLPRIMQEMELPMQFQTLYRTAEKQETVCFDNWQEAALANGKFRAVMQDYPDLLNGWTEEQYQQAVLMLQFQPGGMERLAGIVKAQQRLKTQEQQD